MAAGKPSTGRDAILGVLPRTVYSPTSAAALGEIVAQTARDRQSIAAVGGGTKLGLGRAPTALDAVIRTDKLARILEYAPADMVLVAEAGVTLSQLQATAGEHQQRLALDAPFADRATVGGLVATGDFGPRRAAYGSVRDLIIGVTIVRADGAVAKGGGKVVKNVAGFDLPKVACGSLGTLGLVATASFRLHPLPEAQATLLFEGLTAAQVVSVTQQLRAAQLEPTSSAALRTPTGTFHLGVRFEGFAKGVAHQAQRLLGLGSTLGAACAELDDRAEHAFWQRHDEARTGGSLRLRLAALPSHLPRLADLLAPTLAAMLGPSFAAYPMLGFGFVSGEISDEAAINAALNDLRKGLAAAGGSLAIEAAPPPVRSGVDPWGPPPPSFPLMQRMKSLFDPDRRLNPGRYLGGL